MQELFILLMTFGFTSGKLKILATLFQATVAFNLQTPLVVLWLMVWILSVLADLFHWSFSLYTTLKLRLDSV